MDPLTHSLDRHIVIQASPETVFRYFTDTARWASWWGSGSSIDARPGGSLLIRHPNGIEVAGEVLEVEVPHRIVFTYGYVCGHPIPAGASRVTVRVAAHSRGAELNLTHNFSDPTVRDMHIQGWRFQLSLFANVVADEVNAGAAGVVDGWFAAWSLTDDGERRAALTGIVRPEVRFGDRFSALAGVDDVVAHIGAAQRFMPPMRIERRGDVRHCLGVVLADWAATGANGEPRGAGTNVFTLGADGLIESVTGFWNTAARNAA
jgi:uncharacterized protein YndB with AHSA1/START domain